MGANNGQGLQATAGAARPQPRRMRRFAMILKLYQVAANVRAPGIS